jgi:hypothetical protein
VRRATASVLTIAAVTALACKGSGEATLDLEITASAGGRVDIVRTVDARTVTDSVKVPYRHPFDAQQVVVRVTAESGTAGCRITYGIKVLDEDSGRVASCTATRPGGAE